MADIPRLNGVIQQLAAGKPVFLPFTPPTVENAITISESRYDGCVFEMEHGIYDIRALRDALQYMLSRRQLVAGGTLAPAVTPFVRIPPNGIERVSWIAKQVLDIGIYGIVWPHCSTVEEALNAVGACRYPKREEHPLHHPVGIRGDAPTTAARYWGISNQDYYQRADVWPLEPNGEVLVVIQVEELRAIKNLPSMLEQVPGIGAVLIGEGDLSQEMGIPRQYDHPSLRSAMADIVAICKAHHVPVGHPHVSAENVERVLQEGYTWLMPAAVTSHPGLMKGLQLSGRA
ncbi:MAG TPA: aldolase/citrate lyase family protein [Chloroflexota bacterium]|nr:aldolase/citrate lyase family protein [Chloroflexota bacterium]